MQKSVPFSAHWEWDRARGEAGLSLLRFAVQPPRLRLQGPSLRLPTRFREIMEKPRMVHTHIRWVVFT